MPNERRAAGRILKHVPGPLQAPLVRLRDMLEAAAPPAAVRERRASERAALQELAKRAAFEHPVARNKAEALSLGVYYLHGAGVEGEVAEFGTAFGETAIALARALTDVDRSGRWTVERPKSLHLFDSFEGLPESTSEVDQRSPLVQSGVWAKGTNRGLDAAELRASCERYLPAERIGVHEGWFASTLPEAGADLRLGLLHIDCDLYQSTIDVLDHCFERGMVTRGAMIFFDDWYSNQADPELGEQRAWREMVAKYEIRHTDVGAYGIVSRRFIVHGYRALPERD